MDIAMLFNYIGILVILTNIIVEVLKKITWDKFPTNILVVIISLILTLVSFFAYTNYKNLTIEWYYVVGAIVTFIGLMALKKFNDISKED